jgi:hypothetical protein
LQRVILSAFATLFVAQPVTAQQSKLRFEITVPQSVRAEPLTGRVFVIISRKNEPEPRLQVARTGSPFFGRDVEKVAPGAVSVLNESDFGSPVESIKDIPAGDYYVQGMVSVYSEFKRSDGKVLWMHDDQWEGQQWNRSPGNIYSAAQQVHLDPAKGYVVKLVADKVVPPIQVPPDNQWIKRIKFQSQILSKFWGRPIYIGATVLVPRDFDKATIQYPVDYIQGHFGEGAPFGFKEGTELYNEWNKDNFPRMLAISFQHPTPYFDDSYAVNSPNVGPYGDAITQELIPEIEKKFRAIPQKYARVLSGGSTGGWESLALQIFYPDFFGGTWSACPDPVTFSNVEGVNFYKDENAFYKQHEWYRVPTPNSVEVNGEIRNTSQQRNYFELANGTKGRSGQQIDIWSAVWGPVGDDGYFKPAFDKKTGVIDKSVVEYWRDHWDLMVHLQKNWTTLGPKLVDMIHITVGDMDTYYLNNGVVELEAWMKTTQNPHYEGSFLYGWRKPHCWGGPLPPAERLKEMAQHIKQHAPNGVQTEWWRY